MYIEKKETKNGKGISPKEKERKQQKNDDEELSKFAMNEFVGLPCGLNIIFVSLIDKKQNLFLFLFVCVSLKRRNEGKNVATE